MPAGSLLLLTGSPGCGKTTVAPLIADRHSPSAWLTLDWFFAAVRQGRVEPWLAESHEENRVVLAAAASSVATFAAAGYFTVGESILYPDMLDLFAEACEPHGITLHYAVLRAPSALVRQRVQQRRTEPGHAGALNDFDVVDDLRTKFDQAGIAERHWVDVGTLPPAAVAEVIDRRYQAGDFRL
jgi:predicted kinase